MNRVVIMPALAALLFAAACGGEDGPTTVDTRVSVRFINMTSGMSGSGGFTANGQFVAGSALASGQVAQTCSKLDGGQTSFGFGAVNLAPTTGTTVFNYVFYLGEIGKTAPLANNIPFGIASAYTVVTSGTSTFSALQIPGATTAVPGSTFTLQGGSVNTIALVRNVSGGFQLMNLPRCS